MGLCYIVSLDRQEAHDQTCDALTRSASYSFVRKKSILVTGTAPFPSLLSFGQGDNSVNIAVILLFLEAYKIIICQNNNGVHTMS